MAEKFVPNLDAAAVGGVGADGVRTVPLSPSLDTLRAGVQKMKELAPPTYTSKNVVYAYQQYMDELIEGYETVERRTENGISQLVELTKKPRDLLADVNSNRAQATILPPYLRDTERYFVLVGNILLSGIVDGIDCTMSFIRLAGKQVGDVLNDVDAAPYLEKYVGENRRLTLEAKTGLRFTEILRALAWYINDPARVPECCPPNAQMNMKAMLLPVIYLNGTMVAYYSVANSNDSCVFYPFNTALSNDADAHLALFGVESTALRDNLTGYYNWECNIVKFVEKFRQLSADQQMLFLSALESLRGDQLKQEAIEAFHYIFNVYEIPINQAAIHQNAANLISKPLKIVPFKDIPAGIQGTDEHLNFLTLPRRDFRFPMVPERFGGDTEFPINNYFEALASGKLHAHAIMGADDMINVFVSMENNEPRSVNPDPGNNEGIPQYDNIQPFTFKINGQDVSSSNGVVIPQTNTVSVSVRYKNMIDLGEVLVSLGEEAPAKMSYDKSTETLRYNYGNSTMQPMLPHYVRLESVKRKSDLMPVTKEFAKMIVEKGYRLKMEEDVLSDGDDNYTYTVTIRVFDGLEEVCKPCIRKTYRKEKREVLGDLENMFVPEFSLYPFIKPVDQDKNLLWHQYILTGLHHKKESMTTFLDRTSMTALYEGATEEVLHFFKQRALKNNDYIARTAKLSQIPSGLYMEHDAFEEIGYIVVPEPPVKDCNTNNQAKLALDMGSRRSVINCQVDANPNFNFYQRESCLKRLTEIEIDQNPENNSEQELMKFLRVLFLEGTYTGSSTFVSSVIQYDLEENVSDADKTTPFIGGRIIADMSSEFSNIIKKVFSTDGEDEDVKAAADDALASLGILSDFKRKILASAIFGNFTDAQALFVKDAALHMALNALSNGCANLEYHFSTPTLNAGNDLAGCWNDVKHMYLDKALQGCVITINSPHLESEALYRFKHSKLKQTGAYRYTILIDGGDSTFDISLIEHTIDSPHASTPTVKRNLSIRYAGQNILVDSIRDVCRHWNIKKEEFLLLWNVGDKNSTQKEIYKELSEMLFKYGDTVPEAIWKGEYAKDVIYQLIEKLGLDPMYVMVAKQKYPKHLEDEKRKTPSHEVIQRCEHFWEMVLDIIRFKYLMLMRCILLNVQDLISFDLKDPTKTVQVLLYGNTNHVAELVWPDGRQGVDVISMQQWMLDVFSYIRADAAKPSVQDTDQVTNQETSQITNHVVNNGASMKFKVVSEIDADKKALVQGMVNDDGVAAAEPMKVKNLDELTSSFDNDKQEAFMTSGFCKELKKGELSYPEKQFEGNKHYKHIVDKLANTVSPETQFAMSTLAVGTAVSTLGLEDQDVQEISLDALITLYIINLYLTGYTDVECTYDDATFFPKK